MLGSGNGLESSAASEHVPRAYLDTCLVIGLTNQDLGSEQEALRQILVAHKQRGTLDLVTSRVTEQEIQKGDLPGADEAIYLLL